MSQTFKTIKEFLRPCLINGNWDRLDSLISEIPARQLINPLLSFLYDRNELLKWRSITVIGRTVALLAYNNLESARVIMRRLIWNLNDESGGIGWGSPEAMGEIMVQSGQLAQEYSTILGSYIRKDQNFLEHEMLQRGVLWGIGRLAQARPDLISQTSSCLYEFLDSPDAYHRGLAAWGLGNLSCREAASLLKNLLSDDEAILFYDELQLKNMKVHDLAAFALARIK